MTSLFDGGATPDAESRAAAAARGGVAGCRAQEFPLDKFNDEAALKWNRCGCAAINSWPIRTGASSARWRWATSRCARKAACRRACQCARGTSPTAEFIWKLAEN